MNSRYLLTFTREKYGTDFCWFETEEDLKEFASRDHITVIEGYFIEHAKEVDLKGIESTE